MSEKDNVLRNRTKGCRGKDGVSSKTNEKNKNCQEKGEGGRMEGEIEI